MIFRSHYPDVTIPEIALTPFVLQRANQLAGKPALIDGLSGRVITYSQLASRVRHTAKSLASRGYRKGDVFAIYSPNLPEYVIAFHAIGTIGGIVTTVDPRYTADELANQLKDANAKCLITTSRLLERALAAVGGMESKSNAIEVFTFDHAGGVAPFVELFESVMAPSEAPTNALINPRKDLVALPYPGGYTRSPKGVMRTHYSLVANLCQFDAVYQLDEGDVALGVIPFFQPYGMFTLMLHALWRGATVVTMPCFDLKGFLRAVEIHRVTKAYLTPSMMFALGRAPISGRLDLSSLNLITVPFSPHGETIALECELRLNCPVRQWYGMAEVGPVNNINLGPEAENRLSAAGRLLPNVEARVVDYETGVELGANQPGMLRFRGPHLMSGYWNNPEETARAIDADGWLRSGDVGYVDDEGYFYVEDRIEELIRYKGLRSSLTRIGWAPVGGSAVIAGAPATEVDEVASAVSSIRR